MALRDNLRSTLYGRQAELKLLQDIFCDVRGDAECEPSLSTKQQYSGAERGYSIHSHRRRFVFVSGQSGTGKSSLVETAIQNSQPEVTSQQFLYGSGKFEQSCTLHDARPFGALRSCIADLCDSIVEQLASEQLRHFYYRRLRRGLDHESWGILEGFVPRLSKLLEKQQVREDDSSSSSSWTPPSTKSTIAAQENLEALKYALRAFLVAISSPERPVILCLDDLQWIDASSLKLLEAMLRNSTMNHFVFIGLYRSDEVGSDHALSNMIGTLPAATNISLQGLQFESLVEMLQDAFQAHATGAHELDNKQKRIRSLAELLHSRTNGNAFHVLQLLDFLQAEQLVTFSISRFQWRWDLEAIKDRTTVSDNLVGVVTAKLRRLSKKSLETALICSLLGFRFDMVTLKTAVTGLLQYFSVTSADLEKSIDTLVLEGILDRAKGRIKFSHDKVHQAAREIQGDATELHYKIGKALHASPSKNWSLERKLFLCVDQFNLGRKFVTEEKERLELARLNFLACKRACRLSAFLRALQHSEVSIQLLDSPLYWEREYQLMLELFTVKAELSFVLGNIDQVEDLKQRVLKHARSSVDKIRVYSVSLKAIFSQEDRFEEAFEQLLDILREFGVKLPENIENLETQFMHLKNKFDSMTDEELMSLQTLSNKGILGAMDVLEDVCVALICRDGNSGSIIVLFLIDLSLTYGWAPVSPLSLARFAALAAGFNEAELAIRIQRLSSDIRKRSRTVDMKASALVSNIPLLYWNKSLPQITDNALEAYSVAMRTGDIRSAMIAIILYTSMYFYAGLPLEPVLADLEKLLGVMEDYGQNVMLLLLLPFYQCISNLVGNSEEILDLETGLLKEYREKLSWDGRLGQESVCSLKMQIAFYCGETRLAYEMATKLKGFGNKASKGTWLGVARTFTYCLIEIAQYKEAIQSDKFGAQMVRARRLKEAKSHYAMFRQSVMGVRNMNAAHKLLILDAEMMSIDKSKTVDELKSIYDRAIASSSRVGFLQDAALAAHLASRGIPEASIMYWERASKLYRSWGAHGVVEYVEQNLSQSFDNTFFKLEQHKSSSLRGRERYNMSFTKEHQNIDIVFSERA